MTIRVLTGLKIIFNIALVLCITPLAKAQVDACAPIGWAVQGGTVTGGGATSPVLVTTLANLTTQLESGSAAVIYVQGTIGTSSALSGGDRIDVASNKTLIGLPGAVIKAWLNIDGSSNIIIRNIIFQGPGAHDISGNDCVTIKGGSTRIWVDHCDIRDGEDGNLDITHASDFIAITWTKFQYTAVTDAVGLSAPHSFSNLIGHSASNSSEDNGHFNITFQYNWWMPKCVERQPRVRFGKVHVVNNLYTSIGRADGGTNKSGVAVGVGANVRLEKNYFLQTEDPIDLDHCCDEGTPNGIIQDIGNTFDATSNNQLGNGTAFTLPAGYLITVAAPSVLNTTTFKNCVGPVLATTWPATTITCPCASSLPVDLISFTVTPEQNNYILNWSLTDTKTLKDIIVEFSTDGADFQQSVTLGKDATNYVIPSDELSDDAVLYTRLKFVETDGSVTYSPVRATGKSEMSHVYPNPFVNEVQIKGVQDGTAMVFTIEGSKVYEGSISEPGVINLGHLSRGTYFLTVIDHVTNEVKRIPLIKL